MNGDAGHSEWKATREAWASGDAVCPSCLEHHPHVTRSPLGHLYPTPWNIPPRCKGCHDLLVLPPRISA